MLMQSLSMLKHQYKHLRISNKKYGQMLWPEFEIILKLLIIIIIIISMNYVSKN